MYLDVVQLREFYADRLGRIVQRILRATLREIWPNVRGERVLGLGYAAPFLRPFMDESERAIALMPAGQGASFWPFGEAGLAALTRETELPLETNAFGRVIVAHCLEFTENVDATLEEIWRVMDGGGRVLFIVPSRAGFWARFDNTPFGHGRPFSVTQLRQHLRDHMFVVERVQKSIFIPPVSWRIFLRLAPVLERIGPIFFSLFGGLIIVEATKQLYAGTLVPQTAAARNARRRVAVVETISRRSKHEDFQS